MLQFEAIIYCRNNNHKRKLKVYADDFSDAEELVSIDLAGTEYIYSLTVIE